MTQVGYQEGREKMWWWKVALHLDEAQLALANALAHNLDDQTPIFALQEKLRESQVILLDIFRAKGLLPSTTSPNGKIEVPVPTVPVMSEPAVPHQMIVDAEILDEAPPDVAVVATDAEPPVEDSEPAQALAPMPDPAPPAPSTSSTDQEAG
jgi:hypothetical protein